MFTQGYATYIDVVMVKECGSYSEKEVNIEYLPQGFEDYIEKDGKLYFCEMDFINYVIDRKTFIKIINENKLNVFGIIGKIILTYFESMLYSILFALIMLINIIYSITETFMNNILKTIYAIVAFALMASITIIGPRVIVKMQKETNVIGLGEGFFVGVSMITFGFLHCLQGDVTELYICFWITGLMFIINEMGEYMNGRRIRYGA
ncbi:MAG: hypothetical protein J6N52_04330 [Clostridia bacterium]|nr:hypothetical protein [Clostridia bacterium]